MNNPYKYHLEKLKGSEVVIHRPSATDVKGEVAEVEESGCTIKQSEKGESESALFVFIAYENICGVGRKVWDYEKIEMG